MIYLDNAATTFPKPVEVYEEVLTCMKNYGANPGRGSHDMAIKAASKVMEARQEICSLFNICNIFNLIFTNNATEALNIGIKGILRSGDHVITTFMEHNSVLRPLQYMKEQQGIEVTFLKPDESDHITTESLKKEIKKNTKVIIINHSSNVTGTIQNVKEIGKLARESNVYFMVDVAQSAGIVSIDVERDNIDLLAFPGHKGLLGPQGTGGLFIRDGISLRNFKDGGTGSNSNSMVQPDFLPDKFESGTLNTPGIAGLWQGVKFIQKVGRNNIQKKEEELVEYLLLELTKLPYIKLYGSSSSQNRCAVVSFNIEGIDSSKVGYMLNRNDIAIRTGYHCAPLIHELLGTQDSGTVRISPGYFNTNGDIETTIETIKKIYKRKL